jgi:hypothetical protein
MQQRILMAIGTAPESERPPPTPVTQAREPTPARVRRDTRLRSLALFALFVAGVLTLPAAGGAMPAGGEYGYQAAMIVALREHLQWGTQIVWSYGPFGYLNEPVYLDFNSWLVALVANLVGHFALFAVLALFLFRIKAPWVFPLVGVVALLAIDRYLGHEFERFAVLDQKAAIGATLLLYLAIESTSRREASIFAGLAGLIVGYLFVDKGTYLMAGAGMVVVFAVLSTAARRLAPIGAALGGVAAGYLALWLIAGQSLLNIPIYFRTMYEIAAGYAPAMSWIDESGALNAMGQLAITVGLLVGVGLMLLFTAWRRNWPVARLLLLSAPLVFFQYKNSFIRFSEGHALEFWALLAVVLSLVLARLAAGRYVLKPPAALGAVALVACLVLVGGLGPYIGGFPDKARSIVLMKPSFTFPDNLTSYRHAVSLLIHPARRAEDETSVQASMLALYPLPADLVKEELSKGTVDVVPFDLQTAFAYGFSWDPQPVLLSYSAYRPYLDHLDAEHYLSAEAPDYVLFTTFGIDGRYPLFEEPEGYRTLFERYQVIDRTGDVLVLQRRADAPLPAETGVGSASGGLGDWLSVPAHGDQRIFGRVHVDYSPLGQLMSLVDRPPELTVRLKYAGGQVSPAYRYVPAVGPDGLDLSTYAPSADGVQQLAEGQFEQPIEAIQITAAEPVAAYQQTVKVDYFTQPVL